jgi:hypothetical protein
LKYGIKIFAKKKGDEVSMLLIGGTRISQMEK